MIARTAGGIAIEGQMLALLLHRSRRVRQMAAFIMQIAPPRVLLALLRSGVAILATPATSTATMTGSGANDLLSLLHD